MSKFDEHWEKVSDLGEREIISKILRPLIGKSIGDDCAMVEFGDKYIVATTDKTPEKPLAFEMGLMDYYDLGYYLAVSNLSDVAAMGANPLGFLASTSFPRDFLVKDLESLVDGIRDACFEHGTYFIGGDTSSSSVISLVGSAFGVVDKDKILRRDRQNAGDVVFTTGKIGLFSTALIYFLKAKPEGMRLSEFEERVLKDKLLRPKAKFEEGRVLGESRACTSCMDITDGFVMSAYDLINANNLGIRLYKKSLPIHHISKKVARHLGVDVLDVVFGAGADYELFGSVRRESFGEISDLFYDNGLKIYFVGDVVPAKGLYLADSPFYFGSVVGAPFGDDSERKLLEDDIELIKPVGWQHFVGDAKDVVLRRFKRNGE